MYIEIDRGPFSFNPLTPRISLVILLTVYHTVLLMLVWRIGIGSTYNPLTDICLYCYRLSARYCIDIVRRNSVLVTYGSERDNFSLKASQQKDWS